MSQADGLTPSGRAVLGVIETILAPRRDQPLKFTDDQRRRLRLHLSPDAIEQLRDLCDQRRGDRGPALTPAARRAQVRRLAKAIDTLSGVIDGLDQRLRVNLVAECGGGALGSRIDADLRTLRVAAQRDLDERSALVRVGRGVALHKLEFVQLIAKIAGPDGVQIKQSDPFLSIASVCFEAAQMGSDAQGMVKKYVALVKSCQRK